MGPLVNVLIFVGSWGLLGYLFWRAWPLVMPDLRWVVEHLPRRLRLIKRPSGSSSGGGLF